MTGAKSKNSPSCSMTSSVQSLRHTSIASSTRRPRLAKSSPVAAHSSASQLAPTPAMARPPLTMSSVAIARAATKGWRSPMF
jgi:hypothetical protein